MRRAFLLLLSLVVATAARADHASAAVDPESRVEFTLLTRWGRVLVGRFPHPEGRIVTRPDGLRQVELHLDAGSVEIVGQPRYTALTRGPRFFDVARFPTLAFVSEPYSPQLLREGGALHGEVRIRGIARRERFELAPAACDRPGRACDIVVQGAVRRSDYDLGGWSFALREQVRFFLRVRVRDLEPAP
jgi:polyisoprenoid-binding protein YceI